MGASSLRFYVLGFSGVSSFTCRVSGLGRRTALLFVAGRVRGFLFLCGSRVLVL